MNIDTQKYEVQLIFGYRIQVREKKIKQNKMYTK